MKMVLSAGLHLELNNLKKPQIRYLQLSIIALRSNLKFWQYS
jgi:hypothetical protein